MKNFFIAVLFSVSYTALSQVTETKITLDKIIDHAETTSLYRNNVDWTQLKKDIYAIAESADSVAQLKPALNLMLKELNDDHGRVFYNNKYLSYYSKGIKEHYGNIDWDVYSDIQSVKKYPFKASLLKDKIGYIRIVGLPMGDNQKMAAEIQDAVCDQIRKGASHWIVDLRYNGGGNMFPMIEGITSIIGDGLVGGSKGVTKDESSVWKIENGDFYYDEQNVAIENKCPLPNNPKVAVLTSVYTASSGEVLAVIFKNRDKTRFFGHKTNGKVTVTDWKQINSLTAMSISVGYYMDRKGNVYTEYVDVDEAIDFEPDVEIENGKGIIRAMDWLRGTE